MIYSRCRFDRGFVRNCSESRQSLAVRHDGRLTVSFQVAKQRKVVEKKERVVSIVGFPFCVRTEMSFLPRTVLRSAANSIRHASTAAKDMSQTSRQFPSHPNFLRQTDATAS